MAQKKAPAPLIPAVIYARYSSSGQREESIEGHHFFLFSEKSHILTAFLPALCGLFFYVKTRAAPSGRRGNSELYLLRFLCHSNRITFFIFAGIDEINYTAASGEPSVLSFEMVGPPVGFAPFLSELKQRAGIVEAPARRI